MMHSYCKSLENDDCVIITYIIYCIIEYSSERFKSLHYTYNEVCYV